MKQLINNKYNLPPIKEGISEKEYIYREKYRNVYIKLIDRCKNMTDLELSGYNEKHHIVPRSLGGPDEISNLVLLPIKYHIFAHLLLSEIYPENYSLWYALSFMLNEKSKQYIKYSFSLKYRTKLINLKPRISIRLKSFPPIDRKLADFSGANNPKARAVISPTGKIYGSLKDASKEENIPYGTLTKWLSINSGISNHNWRYLDETAGVQYNDRCGGLSPSAKKIMTKDGTIYGSISEASKDLNIPYTTLRYWLSGRTKDNHGWIYID